MQGESSEAKKMLVALGPIVETLDDSRLVLRYHHALSLAAWKTGDLQIAGSHARTAKDLASAIGSPSNVALSENALGLVAWHRGDLPAATAHFRSAKQIAEETADDGVHGDALNNLGIISWESNDLDSALDFFFEARQVRTKCGDLVGAAEATSNIAVILIGQGQYEKAVRRLQEALEFFNSTGNLANAATTLLNMAVAFRRLGKLDEAWEYGELAKQKMEEAGMASYIPHTHLLFARIHDQRRERQDAANHCLQGMALSAVGGYNQLLIEGCEVLLKVFQNEFPPKAAALALGLWLDRTHKPHPQADTDDGVKATWAKLASSGDPQWQEWVEDAKRMDPSLAVDRIRFELEIDPGDW
jgi:tetratricopeptide (TPR) repeat protein